MRLADSLSRTFFVAQKTKKKLRFLRTKEGKDKKLTRIENNRRIKQTRLKTRNNNFSFIC